MSKNKFPLKEDLELNPDTGFKIAPEGITVMANGSGRDTVTGYFVYPPNTFSEDTTSITTSDRAKELLAIRRQKKEDAIIKAVEAKFGMLFEDVLGTQFAKLVSETSSKKHPLKARMDVLTEISKQTGFSFDRWAHPKQEVPHTAVQINYAIAQEMVDKVIEEHGVEGLGTILKVLRETNSETEQE